MTMKKLVLVIALLVAISVMVVGCGKSESAAIKDWINGFVTAYNADDFEKCTDYLVGVDDLNKLGVVAALTASRLVTGEIEVDSIENISVNGSTATVTVKVTVMSIEQTKELSLSKVDGMWKFEGDPCSRRQRDNCVTSPT